MKIESFCKAGRMKMILESCQHLSSFARRAVVAFYSFRDCTIHTTTGRRLHECVVFNSIQLLKKSHSVWVCLVWHVDMLNVNAGCALRKLLSRTQCAMTKKNYNHYYNNGFEWCEIRNICECCECGDKKMTFTLYTSIICKLQRLRFTLDFKFYISWIKTLVIDVLHLLQGGQLVNTHFNMIFSSFVVCLWASPSCHQFIVRTTLFHNVFKFAFGFRGAWIWIIQFFDETKRCRRL